MRHVKKDKFVIRVTEEVEIVGSIVVCYKSQIITTSQFVLNCSLCELALRLVVTVCVFLAAVRFYGMTETYCFE